jgi:hypothetical protein
MADTFREQVDAVDWYHTFDLPGGIVTPGLFDHRKLPIPASLAGLRCLGPLFPPFGTRTTQRPPKVPRRAREWLFWRTTRQVGGATEWALARPAPR